MRGNKRVWMRVRGIERVGEGVRGKSEGERGSERQ